MNTYKVADIKSDSRFTDVVFLDKSFLLLDPIVPFSSSLKSMLSKWYFTDVFSNGILREVQDCYEEEEDEEEQLPIAILADVISSANQEIENSGDDEQTRLAIAKKIFDKYLLYITAVYTRYATHKTFEKEDIASAVRDLIAYIKSNKKYILRIIPVQKNNPKDFLVLHSLRSTIIAITVGIEMRLTNSRLIELGISCLLHEIGMLRLPPQLYINEKPFSVSERTKIKTHPLIGYQILSAAEFSANILGGVLQHHETESGTGYPQQLTSEKITLYAKIISVACTFEAITAEREHKVARSSYEAMIEMMRNESKAYNPDVIKALIHCMSLFPIGAYVYLINGKIAQVVDVTPGAPRNPVVQIVNETTDDGRPIKVQTNDKDLKIMRVLNKEEVNDILGIKK